MLVRSTSTSGMFAGKTILFDTVNRDNKDWYIKGKCETKTCTIYDMGYKFEVIEDETDNGN